MKKSVEQAIKRIQKAVKKHGIAIWEGDDSPEAYAVLKWLLNDPDFDCPIYRMGQSPLRIMKTFVGSGRYMMVDEDQNIVEPFKNQGLLKSQYK